VRDRAHLDPDEPAKAPPADRRRSRRVPLQAVVQYQLEGNEYIHMSTDISPDGIFIKNFAPPPIGTELEFRVALPAALGGHEAELMGRVVRVVAPTGGEDAGMGIAFTAVRARHPAAVRFFVNEIYEIDHIEQLDPDATAPPTYTFQAGTAKVRPLKQDRPTTGDPDQARIFTDPRQRLWWGLLLVTIGILLGAGSVLIFCR
jgi:hypothetical protein